MQDEEIEYTEMWADISQRTTGKNEIEDRKSVGEGIQTENATDDQEHEYSGFYHPFSNMGQIDLDSSFHGTMSQASWSN